MTTATRDLIELERAGWDALSESGEAATKHYDEVLSDDVLVIMPGGMVIDDRQQVVDSMSGAAWSRYELRDERVLELDPDTAIVAYRGTATPGGPGLRGAVHQRLRPQGRRLEAGAPPADARLAGLTVRRAWR